MSLQAVHDFWQKARQDPALQQKLQGVKSEGKNADIAAVVKIATAAGFAFTAAEYQAGLKEELAREHAAPSLSDEQLAQIAGGRVQTGNCNDTLFNCPQS